MSCPRESRVLWLGTDAVGPEEARSLRAHATTCETCREALDLVAESARALRDAPVESSPESLRRIERALIEGRRLQAELPWRRAGLVLAGAALGAVAVLVFGTLSDRTGIDPTSRDLRAAAEPRPKDERTLELVDGTASEASKGGARGGAFRRGERLYVEPRTRLSVGTARVVAGTAVELAVGPSLDETTLELAKGYVAIAVDRDAVSPKAVVVETRAARVLALGGVFHVRSEAAGTTVKVDEGEVRVHVEGRDEQVLGPGERVFVAQAGVETTAVEHDDRGRSTPRSVERSAGPARGAEDARDAGAAADGVRRAAAEVPTSAPDASAEIAFGEARATRPRETPPVETAPGSEPGARARLEEARSVIARDARAAGELARGVLAEHPAPELEIQALMISADAARRSNDPTRALADYQRVVDHERGAAYAEEALLRIARIALSRGASIQARDAIDLGDARFPRGVLAPERAAVACALDVLDGRVERAAERLEGWPDDQPSTSLGEERLEVARRIAGTDVARARRLLAPLLAGVHGAGLERRARALSVELTAP